MVSILSASCVALPINSAGTSSADPGLSSSSILPQSSSGGSSSSQAPYTGGATLFQKLAGGTDFEYAYALTMTADYGFVVGGCTRSWGTATGGNHWYCARFDIGGTNRWSKTYSIQGCSVVNDVCALSDGGFVFGGWDHPVTCGGVLGYSTVMRTDSNGGVMWSKESTNRSINDPVTNCPMGDTYLVIQSKDGNVVQGGLGPAFLAKMDFATGAVLWSKCYNRDWFYGIAEGGDGSLYACGHDSNDAARQDDFLLVKTDSSGGLVWSRLYGWNGTNTLGFGIREAPDHGYIACGRMDNGANPDDYIVKMDSNGNSMTNTTNITATASASDAGFTATNLVISVTSGPDYTNMAVSVDTDYAERTLWP